MACNFWSSSHCEQWIFTKEDLLRMRSEDMKIYSEEEYHKFMIFWANFIQNLANESSQQTNKIRMQVIATAIVYFKRFYLRRTFKDVCPFALSCTSLLLASKAEEHGQISLTKMSQSIATVMRKYYSINYELKHQIPYDIEFILVETMDCCLIVFHPYRPLTAFLQDLSKDSQMKDFAPLEAQCWKVANDSLRADVALMFPPHIIAFSCIVVGATLMEREKDLKNWIAELTIDQEQAMECIEMLTNMYQVWKVLIEKEHIQPLVDKLPKINVPQQQVINKPQ